jgi:phosphate transport system protein
MPKRFDEGLTELKAKVMSMAALAEDMISRSIAVLVTRDAGLIRRVMEDEEKLDALQREVDGLTVRLICVHTPVAGDLRLLLMVTRMNAELERIGDQSVTVCYCAEDLLKEEPLKPLVDLPRMAELARGMVHRSMDAFLAGSVEGAMSVIAEDDRVDELNEQIFRELITYMLSDPRNISRALGLILAGRAFERIADHAVNIAEDVVYIVQGEDIRHVPKG